ncbi:MAG: U3-containing 90S pre-ribosomal complex subunit-domain containing protein [Olpidium bornovanus]|uniref:U3-containing 90S pre-ribosomal complex subunit-domain containing protein n=1 Tax=Olpidium bornovanus TaxID=278681 RepID=A0A8H8DGM1_9FUNG|nr:MAG: U3-containing 90S pre-ribosomal complex subunit-domain containing protein [Olpidium bornovanus]
MGGDAERLKKPPPRKKACRPVVLVVCTSAIRAANLVKALDDFRKNCTVAKLFAKHMKIDDQVNFLKSSPVNIAVGNPNRLIKLFELGDGPFVEDHRGQHAQGPKRAHYMGRERVPERPDGPLHETFHQPTQGWLSEDRLLLAAPPGSLLPWRICR